MRNVNLSSIGSVLLAAFVAGALALGGCTTDTVTGPEPQEAVQEAPEQEESPDGDSKVDDSDDTADDGDGHNVGG